MVELAKFYGVSTDYLLSELICHKDFQRFMLDAEIYVDRIADMRVNDMNAVLEAVRQMALMKNGGKGKQVSSFLTTFGINYDKLSKEQFVSLIEALKLSKRCFLVYFMVNLLFK